MSQQNTTYTCDIRFIPFILTGLYTLRAQYTYNTHSRPAIPFLVIYATGTSIDSEFGTASKAFCVRYSQLL